MAAARAFVAALLEIENIRDIRLASKALMGLPQHWLQDDVRAGMERLATTARARGVGLAIHTHVNSAQSVTPLVAEATRAMFEAGVRDVRNQGVLMRGVNATVDDLLDLCFSLLDGAGIMPYYFYMCDMIPAAEHWRLAVWEAQALQHGIMGYLPGFATPRIVCDVPYVGKRWVHQVHEYDRERGDHVLDEELPHRHRGRRRRRRSSAPTSTTTRSTRCRAAGQDWWTLHGPPTPRAPTPAARSTADPRAYGRRRRVRASARAAVARRRSRAGDGAVASGGYRAGGRFSYGVESTTLVRVHTLALARISASRRLEARRGCRPAP